MAVTSTPAESSFFRALALLNCKLDFSITYIPNLYIRPKILRGAAKTYFRENHCFSKKGDKIWAFDGTVVIFLKTGLLIGGKHREVAENVHNMAHIVVDSSSSIPLKSLFLF